MADRKHGLAILKNPHSPSGFTYNNGNAIRIFADGRPSQVSRPEPVGESHFHGKRIDQASRPLDNAIRGDDEASIHLGDFLERLADLGIEDTPLRSLVSLDDIKTRGMTVFEDAFVITDDKHRADRFAFTSLAPNFHR